MTTPVDGPKSFFIGDWLADPARDVIARGSEQVKLEPKTMEVLVYLARRAGDVVPRQELEDQIWRGLIVTSQSLYQSIAQLRRVLGDNPRTPQYIETVQRRGYRLIAPVTWVGMRAVDAPAPDVAIVEPVADRARPADTHTFRRSTWLKAAGATVVLLVCGLLGWRHYSSPASPAALQSVAVLSFTDLSNDQSQGYLATALAEELATALGQVDGLKVAARNSSRIAARPDATSQDIAVELGVEHLLQGSVRRVGDRVRVVATLTDARTGYEKWSRTFERPAAAVSQLPADIAGAAAGAIGLALVGDPGVRGSRVGTRDPSAYDFYMLGQQRLNERTTFALSEAERYFQLAIESDPGFAAAYAALADVHIAEFYFSGRQLSETEDLVSPLVGKALEIDPSFGPAQAIRGWMALEDGSYVRAENAFRRAIALSPNDSKAYHWLGTALLAQARPREALDAIEHALDIDPLNFIIHIRHALILDSLGRNADAVEAAARAVTLAPKHPNPRWTLALIATSRGDLAQAIAHYRAALALDPQRSDLRTQLATLLLDAGQPEVARHELADAAKLAQSSHDYLTARAYQALVGEDRHALAEIAESLASVDSRNHFYMTDAADFMALAGQYPQALDLFQRALAADPDSRLQDLWMIRWGLESPASSLAAIYAINGRDRDSDQVLRRIERFLDGAEQHGVRYWGVPYQRAANAALRGDSTQALAHLEEAVAAGWRRTWWARTDPALASLRTRPEFQLLLDRVDGLNRAP